MTERTQLQTESDESNVEWCDTKGAAMDDTQLLNTLHALVKCRIEAIKALMHIEEELENGTYDTSSEEKLKFLTDSTDLLDGLTIEVKRNL